MTCGYFSYLDYFGTAVDIGSVEREVVPVRGSERESTVARERLVVVMACGDSPESSQVGEMISRLTDCCLITVDRAVQAALLRPSGRVTLVVLDGSEGPESLKPALQRIRRRWPGASAVVIGPGEAPGLELAARCGGASFLIRPVSRETWQALLSHAARLARVGVKERLG